MQLAPSSFRLHDVILSSDILQTITSIGNVTVAQAVWSKTGCSRCRGWKIQLLHLPPTIVHKHCGLMVIVQLIQQCNCYDRLRAVSSLGDLIFMQVSSNKTARKFPQTNHTTSNPFDDNDCRPCNLMVTVQLIKRSNYSNLWLNVTTIADLLREQAVVLHARNPLPPY